MRMDPIRCYPDVAQIAVSVEEGLLGEAHRSTSVYSGRGVPDTLSCGNWRCHGTKLPLFVIASALVHILGENHEEQEELRVMCPGSEVRDRRRLCPCAYCYRITVSLQHKTFP